jgi:hypothetical protein
MTHARRDVYAITLGARRRRQFRIVDWTPTDEYITQIAELKQRYRATRRRIVETGGPQTTREQDSTEPLPSRWFTVRLAHELARWLMLARRPVAGPMGINVGYRRVAGVGSA